ncbi:MAG: DUF1016 family protein [Phycisphaerae bacterium]|nr:DUF1016 family protein [Saprospiraceae bacterium]
MATNLDIHEAQTASPAYQQLVADATARVQTGQLAAFRAVNKELIQLYWDLGKMIAERQQANGWGNSVVELLAVDLQKAFPSSSGFSKTNVWRMRAFYLAYRPSAILPPPVGELPPDQNTGEFLPPAVAEIGWTHNYPILEKCKDQTTVEFALQVVNKPIGVATYSISKSLPKELIAFFPSPEELIKRVEAVIKSAGEH